VEAIDFEVDAQDLIPAPADLVWSCLVDPTYMPRTKFGVVVAITVHGEPGMADHTFFTEEVHRHGGFNFVLKTRVLKAETNAIWATLTETDAQILRTYCTLTANGDNATQVRMRSMIREVLPEKEAHRRAAYLADRAAHMQEHADEDAAYFAAAVAAIAAER